MQLTAPNTHLSVLNSGFSQTNFFFLGENKPPIAALQR